MRLVLSAVFAALLIGGPALAQPAAPAGPPHKRPPAVHRPASPGAPVDHGPFTPQASRAYEGGGVVLQGAPGAPPPRPEPTPPGQAPANMVPPR